MNFNNHSNLEGQHAFLGASKYHWINYDESKVAEAYSKFLAIRMVKQLGGNGSAKRIMTEVDQLAIHKSTYNA